MNAFPSALPYRPRLAGPAGFSALPSWATLDRSFHNVARNERALRASGLFGPMLGLPNDAPLCDVWRAVAFTSGGKKGPQPRGLLSKSTKVDKSLKTAHELSGVVYLAAAGIPGFSLCAGATADCAASCILLTGQLAFTSGQRAAFARTVLWAMFPADFLAMLDAEIRRLQRRAERKGLAWSLRPNGTSDIRWEFYGLPSFVLSLGGAVYDYTKLTLAARKRAPAGYSLTYSYSDDARSAGRAVEYLQRGGTVAVVVGGPDGGRSPAKGAAAAILRRGSLFGFPVLDGDEHDARHLDRPGSIVVLYAKGPAADNGPNPFVVACDPSTGEPESFHADRWAAAVRRSRLPLAS